MHWTEEQKKQFHDEAVRNIEKHLEEQIKRPLTEAEKEAAEEMIDMAERRGREAGEAGERWAKEVVTVELTKEECGVSDDLRQVAEYGTEWDDTLKSVADKLDAAAESE